MLSKLRPLTQSRKAQGLSLTTVIIAVLVIIVLVVLVLIFSGKLKIFGSTTSETASQYGSDKCLNPATNNECVSSKIECDQKGGAYMEVQGGYADCYGAQCCFM